MRRVTSYPELNGLTAQRENSYTRCHLALNIHRDLKDKFFDALHRTRFHNRKLVLLGARGEITEGGDGMALDLLVILEGQ